ncbi:hypothetical protein [Nocardia sp. NPDC051750]|uniref:nSTAND1 domain-containing NTPase n=1 Tax=Nocardia sp. NPDC051750 TaxID=3364325 RepID=UPI0037A34D9F
MLLVLIDAVRRRGKQSGVVLQVGEWKRLWGGAQAARSPALRGKGKPRLPGTVVPSAEGTVPFAGRDTAVRSLITMVDLAVGGPREGRVIALTGASGVGKTALLEAVLIPALSGRDMQSFSVRQVMVARDSGEVLAAIQSELRGRHRGSREPIAADQRPAADTHVVVVDQFERLFTGTTTSAARDEIVGLLWELTEFAIVLICLRTSSVPDCSSYPPLADTLENRRYQLEPMTTTELRAVVQARMRTRSNGDSLGIEEALIATICGTRGDAERFGREPAELPILSQTLSSMASNRNSTHSNIDSYRDLGGIEGVVHSMADAVWAVMSRRQRAEVKRILLLLIGLHTDVGYIRRRIPLQDVVKLLKGDVEALSVLNILIDARIVTTDQYKVHLSHDLILTWRLLRGWLREKYPIRRVDPESRRTDRNLRRDRSWEYLVLNPRLLR